MARITYFNFGTWGKDHQATMKYWLIIILAMAAVAFWLWLFRNKTKPASPVAASSDANKYHCVAITPGNKPCESVKRLEGKRFLSNDAPILKLDECTSDSCQCSYIHYDDRRADERRHPYGRYSSINPASIHQERREKPGRRYSDVVDHDADRITDLRI